MKPEYALSVKQPWAWLLCHPDGLKDIENRSWRIGGKLYLPARVYIHAARRFDWPGYRVLCDAGQRYGHDDIGHMVQHFWGRTTKDPDFGAIIGEVTFTACVTESSSPWFEGPFGFVCRDPVLYATPIPCKGRLGFWKPVLP